MSESETRTEKPFADLLFRTPSFEDWAHCPECGSKSVLIHKAERESEHWSKADECIWLECGSCQHESRIQHGDFVAKGVERDNEVSGLLGRLKAVVR